MCESLQVLAGNTDAEAAVTNTFNPKISARYIRVYPVKYRLRVCMRLELYGPKNCKLILMSFYLVPVRCCIC